MGYYALDMHWSAFPEVLKEANLSKLNTILNKVVGTNVLEVIIGHQQLRGSKTLNYKVLHVVMAKVRSG